MDSQKIYLAGNGGTGTGNDLLPYLLGNNGGLFGNNGNGIVDLIALLAVFGNNGFGFGNGGGNSSTERELIMSAIQRTGNDVTTLASSINCSVGQVQAAISALATQVCNLSAQNGQSAMQIINSIQAGNQTLASQLAQCCCDNKLLITQQGYENQIAIANQTNALGSRIDAQTTMINDKFCALEMREMQNKIDALREEKSSLQSTLSNAQQTANIQAFVSQTVAPVAAAVNALQSDVDGIKCKLPQTIAVPADKGIYLNQCTAAQLGLYGNFPFATGASFWG